MSWDPVVVRNKRHQRKASARSRAEYCRHERRQYQEQLWTEEVQQLLQGDSQEAYENAAWELLLAVEEDQLGNE